MRNNLNNEKNATLSKGTSLVKDELKIARRKKVIAGIASMPEREKTLQLAIESIYWQVDEVYVYLNNFDSVPRFLQRPGVRIFRSQDYGDLKDVGKFFALNYVNNGVIFTLDDDIQYPSDYVSKMMDALEAFDYNAVVGVHGIILPEHPKSFFDRKVFTFYSDLECMAPVSFLGTGTCAFDIEKIGISVSNFTSYGMADLFLGAHAKSLGIPSIAIGRKSGWLKDIGEKDSSSGTLYEQTRRASAPHNKIIKDFSPWGQKDLIRRFEPYADSKILSGEVRFAFSNIRHVDQGKPGLPKLPDGCKMAKPYISSFKWIEAYSNSTTREVIFSRIINYLNTTQVRLSALAGLWELNKLLCVENSRYIVEKASDDPIFLLEHAKYCAGICLNDEAKQYFMAAAREANAAGGTSGLDLHETILEYFSFLIKIGLEEEAVAYSEFLQEKFSHHPTYNRGMVEILLSQGEFDAAMPYLTSLFKHIKRRHIRRIRELVGVIASKYASDIEKIGATITVERECIEACRKSYSLLLEVLKVSILFRDRSAAEICWSILVGSYSHELDRHPELRWYYYSNIQYFDGSIDATGHQFFRSDLQRARNKMKLFDELSSFVEFTTDNNIHEEKVSVVMTVHNGEETIRHAAQSILNQTHRNLELIIIDDVSSDGTIEVVENLASTDNRIKLVRNEVNMGPYASRNIALKISSGKFVAIHDADDVALPNRIERQISMFSDDVAAVVGQHVRVDRYSRLHLENDGSILGHGPMTLMVRRHVFDDIGEFSEVRTRGDKEFESRIEYRYGSHALVRMPEILALCLHDLNSNSHEYTNSPERVRSLIKFKESYLRKHALGVFGN